MNDESNKSNGVIIFFVSAGKLAVELVRDIKVDTIGIIDAGSPQGLGLMGVLGDRLQAGPIICESDAEVERFAAYLSKDKSLETPAVDDLMFPVNEILDQLRFDMHHAITAEALEYLPLIKPIPLHQQHNGHPGRYRPEGRVAKHSRAKMHGKKR